MANKAAVAVVKGDWIRPAGSAAPYRRVIGLRHDRDRSLFWLEDPDHPGEPISEPISVARAGRIDAKVDA